MKRCKNVTAWTDYPIKELGDISGKKAPIRRVNVLNYDQNKYVIVSVSGVVTSFKAGYLYRNKARLGKGAVQLNIRKLERMIPKSVDFG